MAGGKGGRDKRDGFRDVLVVRKKEGPQGMCLRYKLAETFLDKSGRASDPTCIPHNQGSF